MPAVEGSSRGHLVPRRFALRRAPRRFPREWPCLDGRGAVKHASQRAAQGRRCAQRRARRGRSVTRRGLSRADGRRARRDRARFRLRARRLRRRSRRSRRRPLHARAGLQPDAGPRSGQAARGCRMKPSLDDIRHCLEGAIPATMATCAADGTPNVAFLSQVEYVDAEHVALSFQFFNKTRANVLANPHAQSLLVDPRTGSSFRLTLHYLRTETSGPLFERMKAKLAGIASHTGMSGVFHLRGSDVYRVVDIECTHCSTLPPPPPRGNRLPALRTIAQKLTACADLEE